MPESHGLLLCDDLIFTSRIVGTASALGLTFRATKTMREILVFLQQSAPRCVILDLQTPDLDLATLLDLASKQEPRPVIVGYGSHVDTATLKRARDAGCDVVWPRSKFVDELAASLPAWFQIKGTET